MTRHSNVGDNMCKMYTPWHMDVFEAPSFKDKGKTILYAVILNDEKYGGINIAYSEDDEHFYFIIKDNSYPYL